MEQVDGEDRKDEIREEEGEEKSREREKNRAMHPLPANSLYSSDASRL